VTSFDSGRPGPHVLITALVHGNEICGAIALDHLFRRNIRPASGRLSLAFVNVGAYRSFDPANPTASRFIDEDFNRLWDPATLDHPRHSAELERAKTLRPLIDTVDLLLDLHSMQQPGPALMLAGMTDKSLALARRIGVPEHIVRDVGHAGGTRLRDYGAFNDPKSPKTALLIECGQHWERRSADIAIDATLRFLEVAGIIPAHDKPVAPSSAQRVITVTDCVTIATERFTFAADFAALEIVPRAGTVIARDGGHEIRAPYDDCVLVMPSRRLLPGQTAVRLGRFTE
jgi:predicted deacylase